MARTLLRVDSNSLAFVILSEAKDLLFAGAASAGHHSIAHVAIEWDQDAAELSRIPTKKKGAPHPRGAPAITLPTTRARWIAFSSIRSCAGNLSDSDQLPYRSLHHAGSSDVRSRS